MHCSIIDNGSIKSNHATNVALIINLNNNTMQGIGHKGGRRVGGGRVGGRLEGGGRKGGSFLKGWTRGRRSRGRRSIP